jgi:hypothetical protein
MSTRRVKYQNVGKFIIESGRDLRYSPAPMSLLDELPGMSVDVIYLPPAAAPKTFHYVLKVSGCLSVYASLFSS